MTLPEDDVYEGAKVTLAHEGWTVIAGQPPNGNDSFPVVEIKDHATRGKGSLGAFKPDLLALQGSDLLILECKPSHSVADELKVISVLEDPARLAALEEELSQRGILSRAGMTKVPLNLRFVGALAHSGPLRPTELGVIVVSSWDKPGEWKAPEFAVRVEGGSTRREAP